MGSEVVRAVNVAPDLELAVGLDVGDDLNELVSKGAEVVVDFTTPASVVDNVTFCVENDLHVVVGTSGIDAVRTAELNRLVADNPDACVFIGPNFGIAAVLMMRFAQQASPYFESVEIIELHHPDKVDAPSGTARRTAELIGAARSKANCEPMPDATTEQDAGARGTVIDGVPVHSARIRGLVAHQEVIMGTAGELLTLRHDSMNRESFMPGVLLAVRNIDQHPGLTVGLEHMMGL